MSLQPPEACRRKESNDQGDSQKVSLYQKNKDMYELVKSKLLPYLQPDALKDINHLFDTQINKTMNELVSKYAPKNRVFCGTSSLQGRVFFALGVHSVTLPNYVSAICSKIGLTQPRCVSFFWNINKK